MPPSRSSEKSATASSTSSPDPRLNKNRGPAAVLPQQPETRYRDALETAVAVTQEQEILPQRFAGLSPIAWK